jgi:hypothetical protein
MKIQGKTASTRSLLLPALLLALVFASSPALAGDFELGLDIGYTQLDNNKSGETELRSGLRAGYYFTESFELEAQYIEVFLDEEVTFLMLNAVFNMGSGGRFAPYTLLGIGKVDLKLTQNSGTVVEEDGFAYQTGFGTRIFFGGSKKISARLELSFLGEETFQYSYHISLTGGVSWKL